MKKVLFTLSLILTSYLMFAQTSNMPISPAVKNQVEVLKKSDLKLSDAQLSRITTVLIAENDKVEKSKQMLEANAPQLQKRLELLKNIMITNIKGGMTPLQIQKFDAAKLGDKL